MAKKADIVPADRGEISPSMEPLLIGQTSRHRGELMEIAVELVQRAAGFRRSLSPSMVESLAELVRSMNCYYSNLIEGHNTHPVDIERALQNDYSTDPRKRNLQREARAHIAVQAWIDSGGLKPNGRPTDPANLLEIHRRFCEGLPEELLFVEDPATGKRARVVPGELRRHDVRVGDHVPVSPGAVPRLLARFGEVYAALGKAESILACAAAHHRLAWIHPFIDGNGRVARLMSHAMLLETLETGGVWSVARGLALSVQSYKEHLANCDKPRRNALDGRGALSEEALAAFTRYFLETCLDQVAFMENLVQPGVLRTRLLLWAEEEFRLGRLPANSGRILEAILYRGELERGDAESITGTGERQARRVVSALVTSGILKSETPRAPLRLVFPAALAARWLPGLFPPH